MATIGFGHDAGSYWTTWNTVGRPRAYGALNGTMRSTQRTPVLTPARLSWRTGRASADPRESMGTEVRPPPRGDSRGLSAGPLKSQSRSKYPLWLDGQGSAWCDKRGHLIPLRSSSVASTRFPPLPGSAAFT